MSKNSYDYYRQRLPIDIYNLHVCCADQPESYRQVAEVHATTKADLRSLTMDLEKLSADVALDIRRQPSKYGFDKVTEGTIKEILSSSEVKAINELRESIQVLEKEEAQLRVLVDSFDQRRSMLKSEVILVQSNYFSDVDQKDLDRKVNNKSVAEQKQTEEDIAAKRKERVSRRRA